MNGTFAVSERLLRGIRGDRRTLGIVFVVPAFLLFLFSEVFPHSASVAPALLAIFIFALTYLLTATGFLRERSSGTLERLLLSPISRGSLVLGYILGFGVLAVVQSVVVLVACIYFMDVTFAHGIAFFFALELLGALTTLGIGILLSLFAENEFQALQMAPLVLAPQIILGGAFRPVSELPVYLELPARVMPVTYLIEGMEYVVLDIGSASDAWLAIGALVVLAALSISGAVLAVRRAS